MKAYLYLARRDKKGIKIITPLNHDSELYSRVVNVDELYLHPSLHHPVKNIIHEYRMEWEPWIESASSYKELSIKLKKRGYKNLPSTASAMVSKVHVSNKVRGTGFESPKTMIQRNALREANKIPRNNK